MVRFMNKNLKAHYYGGKETLSDFLDFQGKWEFVNLLKNHLKNFSKKSSTDMLHLSKKIMIEFGMDSLESLDGWLNTNHPPRIKEVFLFFELILESYLDCRKRWLEESYILDFVDDFNELFLINGARLQIRYFSGKKEFYMEKIISEEVSEMITTTLNNISEHEKTFQDFKNSIKEFSVGNYPESIKLCCKSIEDYLCLILKKSSCSSVESYYKEASKKLKIPQDLDNRFDSLTKYIHKYRSIDSHGRLENIKVKDIELVNESIIQFTMSILNYLKKKNEITTISKI